MSLDMRNAFFAGEAYFAYLPKQSNIADFRYPDDAALFSTIHDALDKLVQAVNQHNATYKLAINAYKTKIMGIDE